MLVVSAPSFLCAWNQQPWRNLWTIILPQDAYTYSFKDLTDSQNLWCDRSILPKIILIFLQNFLDFTISDDYEAGRFCSDSESPYLRKGTMHCSFLIYTQCCMIEKVWHQIFWSSILNNVFRRGVQPTYDYQSILRAPRLSFTIHFHCHSLPTVL